MGCGQSKIDNEESVTRCRERRNLMKQVVTIRNLFASAHSGYSVSLKDTGAALHDYAEGEVPPPPLENVAPSDPPAVEQPPPPPPPPPMESSLPPPPPPLPSFSPMTSTPLQRAVSMPAEITHSEKMKRKMEGIRIEEYDEEEEDEEEEEEEEKEEYRLRKKDVLRKEEGGSSSNLTTPPESRGMAWDYFFMDNIPQPSLDEVEEDEGDEGVYVEDRNSGLGSGFGNVDENVAFMTPEKKGVFEEIEEFKTPEEMPMSGVGEKQFLHSNTAPPAMSRAGFGGGNVVGITSGVDLLKILSDIDDSFLKASQSSQEVSKMLEATKLHYHSNFADNRGHIDHAARVMQVITWNKSFRGAPNGDGATDSLGVGVDDYDTHATVLDKLLAWEKKLYEEVKAGELMKIEYQRKVSVLNRLKKRNSSPEQLEKAKAAVSHLHTRYIVDMQSLDSTVSEVNDIRDKQLYPKLVALVHGMMNMWESMCMHHDNQLKIVTDIKALDITAHLIETSQFHHERTKQLASVVDHWCLQFEKLVTNQKQYINILYTWLKLNLVPTESSLREKVSSPPRNSNPPIQPLLANWNDHLDKLPDEMAKSAIVSFSAVIHTIILHQEEEMKAKETYEETRKEYLRKKQGFEDWHQKYVQRRGPQGEMDPDKAADPNVKDPVSERQTVVEGLKKRLDEEIEKHRKLCIQVREKSALNLRIRLPELFRALSNYSHASLDAYERLRRLSQSQLNRGS